MKSFNHKAVIFLEVLVVSFIFSTAVFAAAPQYVLRYACNQPPQHLVVRGAEMFSKLVGEKTGGRVKVEVYPMGQLFTDKDFPRAIPEGALDIGSSNLSLWSGKVPAILASDLTMTYKSAEQHLRFHDSPGGNLLKAEVERKAGVKFIHWYGSTDGTYFVTNKPIRKVEDLKGLRLRTSSEILAVTVKAMGAAPTMLSAAELYLALQRGMLDGAVSAPNSILDRKLQEVTKHITQFPGLTYLAQWVLMNKAKFDSLPADVQKAILEAGQEVQKWQWVEEQRLLKESLEILKKADRQPFIMPAEEMKKLQKIARPEVMKYFSENAGDLGKKVLEEAEKGGFTF
jgi:TRAP-type C4-dicarboxylate transport system substrate-binding protein